MGVHLLLVRLRVERRAAVACFGALAVVILTWAIGGIVPDLLTVALGLLYLRLALAAFDDGGSARVALGSGLLAGVAYLAKAAFLPFFLLTTATLLLVHVRRHRDRRRPLTAAGLTVLGASLLVVPWAVAISAKYGHTTIGTASSYNLAIIGPGWSSLSVAHPQDTAGLLPPPDPSATSAWTDPSLIPVTSWNPLSVDGAGHELRNIALNLAVSLEWMVRYWLLAPLVVIWALWRFRRTSDDGSASDVPILGAAALLMLAVYLPLLVESRYLWLPLALLPMLGAVWWTAWCTEALRRPTRGRAIAVLAVGVALLVAQPLHHLVSDPDSSGRPTLAVAERLRAMGVQGNLASDAHWSDDLYLAYHLGVPYYGTVAADDPDDRKREQLRADDIRWFLLHADTAPDYLRDFVAVGTVPEADLTVFRRA